MVSQEDIKTLTLSRMSQLELSNTELTVNHTVKPKSNNPDFRTLQTNNYDVETNDYVWRQGGKTKIQERKENQLYIRYK